MDTKMGTILLVSMALTSAVNAGSMGPDVDPDRVFNGFYLGFGAVALNTSSKVVLGDSIVNRGWWDSVDADGNSGFLSAGAKFEFGYGHVVGSSGYVGGELSYRYAPQRGGDIDVISNQGGPSLIGEAARNDFSGLARGGYFFVPGAMGYLGVGLNGTEFLNTFTDTNGAYHQSSKWSYGGSLAAGMELKLAQSLTMDLRYTYTAYEHINASAIESETFWDRSGSTVLKDHK